MNTTGSEAHDVTGAINLIASLAKVKPVEAREKLNKLLEKLERTFAKTSFNFILKGIPDAAPVRDTGIVETIGYPHTRDTLGQFGKYQYADYSGERLHQVYRADIVCSLSFSHKQHGNGRKSS
jgi:hypothetical protein